MAFDGVFAKKTVEELNVAIDCHIDKIYQPSKDELVLLLRKKGFVKKLLLSAKIGSARVCFTETKYENPPVPPMFCMLIRKHFLAAKLIKINQTELERVVEFYFQTTNEMGDIINPKIVCELIGNKANIVLVGENGRIIDAVRRSSIEDSARIIQPGAIYSYPDSQGKLNLLNTELSAIIDAIKKNSSLTLSSSLLRTLDGASPLVCREIAFLSGGDELVEECDFDRLFKVLSSLKNDILIKNNPVLLLKDGEVFDFTYTEITQYGDSIKNERYESFSGLLDAFYQKREASARIKLAAGDILRLTNNLISRAEKRRRLRLEDLSKCENREQLRIYGELLKANLYALKSGASFAEVQNYYDEELKLVRIPLNPALSPANNAAKYFKDYKKTYTAEQTLLKLISDDEAEIGYLETVLDAINRAETLADIAEIRTELLEEGYLNAKKQNSKPKKIDAKGFKEYQSVEGYRILVGKNNRQNDYLTTKFASKNDLWFHTKNIPGSHVLVLSNGAEVSDETILFAARLAAENSKASSSSNVAVDYTQVKNVKKPSGAKAGMVIYTTNKTVFVTPLKEEKE